MLQGHFNRMRYFWWWLIGFWWFEIDIFIMCGINVKIFWIKVSQFRKENIKYIINYSFFLFQYLYADIFEIYNYVSIYIFLNNYIFCLHLIYLIILYVNKHQIRHQKMNILWDYILYLKIVKKDKMKKYKISRNFLLLFSKIFNFFFILSRKINYCYSYSNTFIKVTRRLNRFTCVS